MYTAQGIPIKTPRAKLDALRYCVEREHTEDVLCHVCDLLRYYAAKTGLSADDALRQYGRGEVAIDEKGQDY